MYVLKRTTRQFGSDFYRQFRSDFRYCESHKKRHSVEIATHFIIFAHFAIAMRLSY